MCVQTHLLFTCFLTVRGWVRYRCFSNEETQKKTYSRTVACAPPPPGTPLKDALPTSVMQRQWNVQSIEEINKIDGCEMDKFGTSGSSEKTVAILADRWPQTDKTKCREILL